jgi:hypothetical protein
MSLELVLVLGRKARAGARRFHAVASLVVVACIFANFTAAAQDEPLPEYKVKSAFLYNFAKFIQWPPRKFVRRDEPLIIGVIGRNPFGDYLQTLEGKPIGSHTIHVEVYSNAREARRCHVLYVGAPARAARIIDEVKDAGVLTITDDVEEDSFKSAGAVINLFTTANKTVHFEINVDAARRAELQINSSLLNLAKIVRDGKA